MLCILFHTKTVQVLSHMHKKRETRGLFIILFIIFLLLHIESKCMNSNQKTHIPGLYQMNVSAWAESGTSCLGSYITLHLLCLHMCLLELTAGSAEFRAGICTVSPGKRKRAAGSVPSNDLGHRGGQGIQGSKKHRNK